MKKIFLYIWMGILLLIPCLNPLPASAVSSDDIEIDGYVTDYTGTLSRSQIAQMDEKGRQLDADTGAQVVFVIVDTLDGEDIFQASYQLAVENEVGSKNNDSGLLFLIALEDREYFMQIGMGLEGILTDIQSKHLMDTYLVPYLKSGDYAKALTTLYAQIIDYLQQYGNQIGSQQDSLLQQTSSSSSFFSLILPLLLFAGVLFLIWFFGFRRKSPMVDTSEQPLVLGVGEKYYLNASGYNFSAGGIAVSSSNPSVVSVQSDGWITGMQPGTATIYVQKSGEERRSIPVQVVRSGGGNSRRRNDDLLSGFLLGSLLGSSLHRRRMYPPYGGFGPGPAPRRRPGNTGPFGPGSFGGSSHRPSGGFGGFGSGGGFGGGGFRGGGGGFRGGGSGGKW